MYAIVDIETTGGYAFRNKVIDIAILVYDGEKVVEEFSTLINPERPIPRHISNLTGITDAKVDGAPKFYEVAKRIMEITDGKVFVAHNVGFDYSFIKQEFEDLGAKFSRKRLCTIRLSRKIFSGLPSYSLGNLCSRLGIAIEGRHTALGDAAATVKLFSLLTNYDNGDIITSSLKPGSREGMLPPNLPASVFENLPEETGVYYFHNEHRDVVYVGKAKNIRERVMSHFVSGTGMAFNANRKNSIYDITWEITGSELVALIHESHEIKRLQPLYNQAQKRARLPAGIVSFLDGNGYRRLEIGRTGNAAGALIAFPGVIHARNFLEEKVKEFSLCPRFCGLQKSGGECFDHRLGNCSGACAGKESPAAYNRRVEKAIKSFASTAGSFAVLGKGRSPSEKSVVLVERGVFLGYGYLDGEVFVYDPSEFRTYIRPGNDNQDVQRIIGGYIRQNKGDVVISYSAW